VRLQDGPSTCGQTTVVNLLKALGRAITMDQVRSRLKKITNDGESGEAGGTTEAQIAKLLGSYKIPVMQVQLHSQAAALSALRGLLLAGYPVALAVDNDTHWVLATGVLGRSFNVVDPADGEVTLVLDETRLAGRWGSSGDPHRFYGLAAGKGLR
jgi:ABC-type bacteriocin/lantibiotic exporter with double-glycine peptidase domain